MKGVGGPLLSIGDLLSDLEENPNLHQTLKDASLPSSPHSSLDLTNLFQENYNQLNEAFARTDHSWTSLTLKLCTSLETANELVQSTNSNVILLSEKVEELEKIVKRGDSAVAAAKAVHVSLNQKGGSFARSQYD
ncbi:hypothetical protein M5689_025270 [Euphorbia peplus]|nr:hypothetical protein M5689_025270 [Euphorbia peplus]